MINGNEFLLKKYSNFPKENIQSSGMDLNLGQVYELCDEDLQYGLFIDEKVIPKHIPCQKDLFLEEMGYHAWALQPKRPYILEVDRQIDIGDSAQIYFPRSTLLRAGVDIRTALGDKGYNGKLSFLAINHSSRPFFIEKGVRFAQLIDCEVKDSSEDYDGDYQEPKLGGI